MALGFDTWLAEIAIACEVPLVCALPFKGQGDNWPTKSKDRYQGILQQANEVHYVSLAYDKTVFHKRDYWMVDHLKEGDHLIACWDGRRTGGTWATLGYAKNKFEGKKLNTFNCHNEQPMCGLT